MAASTPLASFTAAIERAYTLEPKPADNQADFDRWYPQFAKAEYDTAIQVINRVRDLQLLGELLEAYLRLYAKHAANRLNVHFVRSDQTLLELFERCKKLSTRERDLLGEWAGRLDDKTENPLRKRFAGLSPTYQAAVRALVPKPQPAPVNTLLGYLRDEYEKKRGYRPEHNADLYSFDPRPDDKFRNALQGHLDSAYTAWSACLAGNEPMPRIMLHATLDVYRKYLATIARQDLMLLFQAIKYLQDRIFTRRENMGTWTRVTGGDKTPLTCELYAMACLQLLVHAQGVLVLPTNRQTFTREEREYFLQPLTEPKYEYLSNIADRFTRELGNVGLAFDLSKTFLDLILVTRVQARGATLLDLAETHRMQEMWSGIHTLAEKFKKANLVELVRLSDDPGNQRIARQVAELAAIEVPLGKNNLGIAYAHVGSSPGVHQQFGQIRIVYIDPKNPKRFYIEYEALRPNLFLVDPGYIAEKVYAYRIMQVAKGTAGIIYIVAGLFLMMGFMPVFIEAGFAGLLAEIAVAFAASKIGEQARQIHPYLGIVIEFALQLAAPRPRRFGIEVKAPEPAPRVAPVKPTGVPAIEARGARQPDAGLLATDLSKVAAPQRAPIGEPVPTTPAPAAREGALAAAGRGEPFRPWQHQQLQQQQTRAKPPAPPPSGQRPVIRQQQAAQPVGQRLQRAEPEAKPGTAAEEATAAKGTAGRGIGERPPGEGAAAKLSPPPAARPSVAAGTLRLPDPSVARHIAREGGLTDLANKVKALGQGRGATVEIALVRTGDGQQIMVAGINSGAGKGLNQAQLNQLGKWGVNVAPQRAKGMEGAPHAEENIGAYIIDIGGRGERWSRAVVGEVKPGGSSYVCYPCQNIIARVGGRVEELR